MGIWSWLKKRICSEKDVQSLHTPAFEPLEPRILFSGDVGTSDLWEFPLDSQVDQVITADLDTGSATSNKAISGVVIIHPGHAPVAEDDLYSISEGWSRAVEAPGVLLNDKDSDGHGLSAIKVTDPEHGLVRLKSDGSFVYVPDPNWWGLDSFTYRANDGQADSNVATVYLAVGQANSAPSFTPGADVMVHEDSGPQTIRQWATAISAGPSDESGQTLRFILTCDNPALFSVQPAISPDGTLTFTSAPKACGQAVVNVWLKDSGGTENGGVDTSSSKTFRILVLSRNDAPVMKEGGSLWLASLRLDERDNPGTLVTDLLASGEGDLITDVDPGALEGIAVIGANSAFGTWEFSTDAGMTWMALGSASLSNARLLAANAWTRIRFVPKAGFIGTVDPGITFRAWDQTSGLNGATADATYGGAARAFSSTLRTSGIMVYPVVQLPGGKGSNAVKVYRKGDNLRVVDARKRVLLDQPLSSIDRLIIVGADNKSDTVTVDLGAGGNFTLEGGLLFEGGSGRQTDTLILRGTAGSDHYQVGRDLFVVNELAVLFKDLEQVRLEGMAGDDTYDLLGLGVPVVLSERSGIDTLNFSYALSSVTIDLGKAKGQWQQVLAGSAKLALKGIFENVVGTTWADVIRGNKAHNRLWGWGGNDQLYGGSGNDWLFGETGNDRLFGDAGNDILVGGEGDDQIQASKGKNILIGGLGNDVLTGGSSEDILIGGTTSYDGDGTALQAIMAEWTARRSLAGRIANLTKGWGSNGSYVLWLGVTVREDYSLNVLSGGRGSDWFLFFVGETLKDRGSKDR